MVGALGVPLIVVGVATHELTLGRGWPGTHGVLRLVILVVRRIHRIALIITSAIACKCTLGMHLHHFRLILIVPGLEGVLGYISNGLSIDWLACRVALWVVDRSVSWWI